jgi:hypothetical protein
MILSPRCLLVATALAGCLAAAHAAPQKIYRCGPDGRVLSQTPCKDGVDATRPVAQPTSDQREAARRAADTDKRLADQLARERRERDAAAAGQRAAGFETAPKPVSSAASAPKPKGKTAARAASAPAR